MAPGVLSSACLTTGKPYRQIAHPAFLPARVPALCLPSVPARVPEVQRVYRGAGAPDVGHVAQEEGVGQEAPLLAVVRAAPPGVARAPSLRGVVLEMALQLPERWVSHLLLLQHALHELRKDLRIATRRHRESRKLVLLSSLVS